MIAVSLCGTLAPMRKRVGGRMISRSECSSDGRAVFSAGQRKITYLSSLPEYWRVAPVRDRPLPVKPQPHHIHMNPGDGQSMHDDRSAQRSAMDHATLVLNLSQYDIHWSQLIARWNPDTCRPIRNT